MIVEGYQGMIKQSNIKVQIHMITDRKDYRQINNFGDIIV